MQKVIPHAVVPWNNKIDESEIEGKNLSASQLRQFRRSVEKSKQELLGLRDGVILAELVLAVQELVDKVDALEKK